MFPISQDGSVLKMSDFLQHYGTSVDPDRQEGPHVHCCLVDKDNKYLVVIDLGLDKIFTYSIDLQNKKLKLYKEFKT